MNKDELKQALHEGAVRITFTKKDGSERTGWFTLQADVLAEIVGTGKSKTINNPDLIVATEIAVDGNNQWRSFNFDQITDIKTERS